MPSLVGSEMCIRDSIIRDDAPYPSDPEGETESYCYYGGVHNTCDAIPDYGRRFCPCDESSIGLPSPYPSYVNPGPPSLNPANAFSTAGIVWVQGLVGQSCTSTCLSLSASCSSSGPWPMQYSDFTTLLSVSYDLTACTSPPDYKTCQSSSCSYIYPDYSPHPFNPVGGTGWWCTYGSGYSTCDATPNWGRRFCPCDESSIGLAAASPSSVPSVYLR